MRAASCMASVATSSARLAIKRRASPHQSKLSQGGTESSRALAAQSAATSAEGSRSRGAAGGIGGGGT